MSENLAKFSDQELIEAFEYLDDLRESGVTNMFGAARYIQAFLGHELGNARTLLSAWMSTFEHDATVEDRVAQARAAQ